MKSTTLSRRQVLSLLPLAAAPSLALADGKPIEWVVGYAPGGGSDTVARMLAEAMGRSMGRSIIIINKPGAGSNIAGDYVAKARDAEHMVFTADSAVIAANPFLYSKLTYSAERTSHRWAPSPAFRWCWSCSRMPSPGISRTSWPGCAAILRA